VFSGPDGDVSHRKVCSDHWKNSQSEGESLGSGKSSLTKGFTIPFNVTEPELNQELNSVDVRAHPLTGLTTGTTSTEWELKLAATITTKEIVIMTIIFFEIYFFMFMVF
jgi:hypothetical protein